MPNYAVYNNTTRLGANVESFNIAPPSGSTTRLLSTPEFDLVDSITKAGNRWVVDNTNVVRLATASETDSGFTPRQYFLKRIPELAVANRPAAYDTGLLVEFALLAKDKPGAQQCVDVSTLPAGAKTKLTELISNYVFPN